MVTRRHLYFNGAAVQGTCAVARMAVLLCALSAATAQMAYGASSHSTTDYGQLAQVATGEKGSGAPTYYPTNHRIAVTNSERVLLVYGRHADGIQLAWRDPGAEWRTDSTGHNGGGSLIATDHNENTGDWPASIAIAPDDDGDEHAWVVWSGQNSGAERPLRIRRLTNLNSPNGPHIGPAVTIDAPELGAYRADISFERSPAGEMRGCVLYSRRISQSTYELRTTWFTNLDSDQPAFGNDKTLSSGRSAAHFGSLIPAGAGMRVLARAGSPSRLSLYRRDRHDDLDGWTMPPALGPVVPPTSSPTGVALDNGDILATVATSTGGAEVYRFPFGHGPTVEPTAETTHASLADPSLTSDGHRAWLIGVRGLPGDKSAIISRAYLPSVGAWSGADEVLVSSRPANGPWRTPTVDRDATRGIQMAFAASGASENRSSVWFYDRLTSGSGSDAPSPPHAAPPDADAGTPYRTLSWRACRILKMRSKRASRRARRAVFRSRRLQRRVVLLRARRGRVEPGSVAFDRITRSLSRSRKMLVRGRKTRARSRRAKTRSRLRYQRRCARSAAFLPATDHRYRRRPPPTASAHWSQPREGNPRRVQASSLVDGHRGQ